MVEHFFSKVTSFLSATSQREGSTVDVFYGSLRNFSKQLVIADISIIPYLWFLEKIYIKQNSSCS